MIDDPAEIMTNSSEMPLATIASYQMPDQSTLIRTRWKNAEQSWAIRQFGACLNKNGEWIDEPQPSDRDEAFFANCRWPTAQAAYQCWHDRVYLAAQDQSSPNTESRLSM